MAFEKFIPTIWEAKLDVPFQKALVYGQDKIANREYEGQIQQMGDTVTINRLITGEIKDYVKGVPNVSDQLDTDDTKLTIDAQKYYQFDVEDIDKTQAAGSFTDTALTEYAYKMADVADIYNRDKLIAGAGHTLPAVKVFNGDDYHLPVEGQITAWNVFSRLKAAFEDAGIPEGARWAVIGGDLASALLSDKRVTDAAHAGDNTILLNGQLTAKPVLGINVTVSPNVKTTGSGASKKETLIAGVSGGYSFANQLVQTEAFRSHTQFADTFRSLNLWGGAVIRPDRIFKMDVTVGEGALMSFGAPAAGGGE